MKIAVVGTGYVGLISGVGLASIGHTVTCFDVRADVIERLSRGEATIYEPGLAERLARLGASGQLNFAVVDERALSTHDVVLIAVGTPSKAGDIDLSFVRTAAGLAGAAIARAAQPMSVIVKSTVVPGTTAGLVREVIEAALSAQGASGKPYGLGMNPEFLREGSAIADFDEPDRIVFGYENERALEHLREMYAPFNCPKLEVSTKTAELIKYANNYFLALQISATNEIANLASTIGEIDPIAVMDGVKLDRRWAGDWQHGEKPHGIGSYLVPGPGFGGSCFPKDVEALVALGRARGSELRIGHEILAINAAQPRAALRAMFSPAAALDGATVLVLGLAFKPDTDDVRETPAVGIIRALTELGARVQAHDPLAQLHFMHTYGAELAGVDYVTDWRAAAAAADAVILVTPWREYRAALADGSVRPRVLADPRRAIDPATLAATIRYASLGRPVTL